jgi:hypothetical protein
MKLPTGALAMAMALMAGAPAAARQESIQAPPAAARTFADPSAYVPDLGRLVAATSELRDVVARFDLDRQALQRFHTVPGSDERRARLRAFQQAWLAALPAIDFDTLSRRQAAGGSAEAALRDGGGGGVGAVGDRRAPPGRASGGGDHRGRGGARRRARRESDAARGAARRGTG